MVKMLMTEYFTGGCNGVAPPANYQVDVRYPENLFEGCNPSTDYPLAVEVDCANKSVNWYQHSASCKANGSDPFPMYNLSECAGSASVGYWKVCRDYPPERIVVYRYYWDSRDCNKTATASQSELQYSVTNECGINGAGQYLRNISLNQVQIDTYAIDDINCTSPKLFSAASDLSTVGKCEDLNLLNTSRILLGFYSVVGREGLLTSAPTGAASAPHFSSSLQRVAMAALAWTMAVFTF